MVVKVYLSGHLTSFSGGEREVALAADPANVAEALEALWRLHPALRDRVLDEQDNIRTHVNIFVGSRSVKKLDGLETAIDYPEIHIFNAVSGG